MILADTGQENYQNQDSTGETWVKGIPYAYDSNATLC
jgi:hypothetical protein